MGYTELDTLAINTIRCLSIDMVQAANSGHPGLPLGCAPMAYVLRTRFLQHNPANPHWFDRDRFILSAGHGSTLLYSLLHLTGYDLSLDDLKQFRQRGSKTPGHPENFETPGVEMTTGPLGQGLSSAVGMAIAERHLAATYNTAGHDIIDHFTYVLCGDGDLMEGITSEASSLAGHLGLGKLITLYDSNQISIDGSTDIAFTENVAKRYESYGWYVQTVEDGNTDLDGIETAIRTAQGVTDQPSMIIVKTTIGYGSPHKSGSSSAHGAPLGEEEIILTKQQLGRPTPEASFIIPTEVQTYFENQKQRLQTLEDVWQTKISAAATAHPSVVEELQRRIAAELPTGREEELKGCMDTEAATRKLSGNCLTALADIMPEIMGGSADLTPSNNTNLACSTDFQKNNYKGRNIKFGVREHAMGAIANGLSLHGGFIPFVATFLIFTDYMKAAMRLSALSKLRVLYIMTHDSIGVGEDGPTHQPIETIAGLRCIPNLYVMRPADAREVAACYKIALDMKNAPSVLALTRQGLPALEGTSFDQAQKGGYIISSDDDPEIILLSTGSELQLATQAAEALRSEGKKVRVVSLVCWKKFEEQSAEYKNSVLPPHITKRVAVEAGHSFGRGKYVGLEGKVVSIDTFGASAPGNTLMEKFGFTVENVLEVCKEVLR